MTIFLRGVLCNWMVSMGVVGAMVSTSVSGKATNQDSCGLAQPQGPLLCCLALLVR